MKVLLVLSTFPDTGAAESAGREMVERRLAACASVLPGVKSIYRWQGAIEEAAEVLVLFKILPRCWPEFRDALEGIHPYDVPEILAFETAAGLDAYLAWVETECAPSEG